jgi:hypothetical protein
MTTRAQLFIESFSVPLGDTNSPVTPNVSYTLYYTINNMARQMAGLSDGGGPTMCA